MEERFDFCGAFGLFRVNALGLESMELLTKKGIFCTLIET